MHAVYFPGAGGGVLFTHILRSIIRTAVVPGNLICSHVVGVGECDNRI